MKRLFSFILTVGAVFSVLSCEKQQENTGHGEELTIVFNVSADGLIQSKTIGSAVDYDKELSVFIYKDGVYVDKAVADIIHFGRGLKATASVRLVKGQKYDIVFWAQAKDSDCYSINPETGVLKVDYSALKSNDDTRDAFCHTLIDFAAHGQGTTDVVLRRPFAQINVGTAKKDVNDAGFAGVSIDMTSVVLGNVADEMDLRTGLASGNVSVEFSPSHVIKEDLVIYKGTENEQVYEYLSMNYVLVGDGSAPGEKVLLKDYGITFYEGDSPIYTMDVPNVPVRRNWRTNIIGHNLLTESSAFDIVIDPDFFGEYDYNSKDIDKVLYRDSETGVYLIENPAQLSFLSEVVNEGYDDFKGNILKLDKNLDMSGWNFQPLGTYAHPFRGTFDGNGKVISSLTVKSDGNAGLFGVLNGKVKNLTLEGVDISGNGYVGGMVGYLNGTVDKCKVDDSIIKNVAEASVAATGSVVGYAASSAIIMNVTSNVSGLNAVGYEE